MKKVRFIALLLLAMVVALAACSSDDKDKDAGSDDGYSLTIPGSTVEGRDGNTVFEEVTLTKKPETVVVFDNGFLDTLDALDVEITAIPKSNVPSHLSHYDDDKYENAGTLFEPDYEKLSSLNPDIIFISGRASAAYDELKKIAPTVYVGVDNADFLASFEKNVELAGKIFDKETEAKEAFEAYEAKVAEVKEAAEATDDKALIVLGNEGSLSAYGSGSRFGVIHDVYGVKAADDNIESSTHGADASFEYVLDVNPDMLFVVDRDAVVQENGESGTKDAIENEIVSGTNAVKDGKVFYLNPETWYLAGGGLQSETLKAEEILAAFK